MNIVDIAKQIYKEMKVKKEEKKERKKIIVLPKLSAQEKKTLQLHNNSSFFNS